MIDWLLGFENPATATVSPFHPIGPTSGSKGDKKTADGAALQILASIHAWRVAGIALTYTPTVIPVDLTLLANDPREAKHVAEQVLGALLFRCPLAEVCEPDTHGGVDVLINCAGLSTRGATKQRT